MIKKILLGVGLLALVVLIAKPALAADTGAVSATVTPKNISVSVSPTSVSYGILALSASDASRTTALSGTFTVSNDGNVTETFNIKGTNATGGGGDTTWTLNSSPAATGTVGANQYVHRYDEGASFTDGEAAALSTGYLLLKSGIAASGTANSVLQMNMPTSTTGNGLRTSTVTVQATE